MSTYNLYTAFTQMMQMQENFDLIWFTTMLRWLINEKIGSFFCSKEHTL